MKFLQETDELKIIGNESDKKLKMAFGWKDKTRKNVIR
jgi:hypothetical protein